MELNVIISAMRKLGGFVQVAFALETCYSIREVSASMEIEAIECFGAPSKGRQRWASTQSPFEMIYLVSVN